MGRLYTAIGLRLWSSTEVWIWHSFSSALNLRSRRVGDPTRRRPSKASNAVRAILGWI